MRFYGVGKEEVAETLALKELDSFFPFEERELQRQKILPRFQRKKVILISGPTAIGKTRVSLKLAEEMGGEIVSADSMQVFRGMDIGTSKVEKEMRERIPHHLIDTRGLQDRFSVAQFYEEAKEAIRSILGREKVPIVVGGTGFYIHSLLYGPPLGPPSNPELRARLEEELSELGSLALFDRVKKFDPKYAATITPNDRHKIIRALEIIELSKQGVSEFPKDGGGKTENYNYRAWFLFKDRSELYPIIDSRCEKMVADGLVEEVERLLKEGLRDNLSASQAIGYRQAIAYLDGGKLDYEQFLTDFKRASRHYAKRQFTWFRREPLFRWLDIAGMPLSYIVETIAQDYEISFN